MNENDQANNSTTKKGKKIDKAILQKIKRNNQFVSIVDHFYQNENDECDDFIKCIDLLKKSKKKTRKKYLCCKKKRDNVIHQKSDLSINNINEIKGNTSINENHKKKKSTWRLITMMLLNGAFFFVEMIVGLTTHSLALQTDAFNMLSDEASVIIGFIVHQYSKKLSTPRMAFGYVRAEAIGGLCNSVFMYAVSLTILLNAIELFVDPHEIEHSLIFLIVGIIGLIVNLFGILVFVSSDNDNIKGVFIHELGDFLGSVGVLISALIQNYSNSRILKMYIDPIISIIISIILTVETTGLFKKTIKIVAETVPAELNVEEIKKTILQKVSDIADIHDFHVWELTDNIYMAVMHVLVDSVSKSKKIVDQITNYLLAYGIFSTTIQIECKEDFPSIISEEKNRCNFASQYNHRYRIFKSNPNYQHLIGCNHISLIEKGYEDNYDYSDDDSDDDINVGLKEFIEP